MVPPFQTTSVAALGDLFATTYTAPACDAASCDVDRQRLARRIRAASRNLAIRVVDGDFVQYTHRPFDTRWMYAPTARDSAYFQHAGCGTEWLAVQPAGAAITRNVVADGTSRLVPLHAVSLERTANLTREGRSYLLRNSAGETELFRHAAAVLAVEPRAVSRIPLPDSAERLRTSAGLGVAVAALFRGDDAATALRTSDPSLRFIGTPTRVGKEARMLRGSALMIDDSWLGDGHVEVRPYDDEELVAISEHARATGLTTSALIDLLGATTVDVYLNDKAFCRNVPLHVWQYTFANERVLPLWLRDRAASDIGRPLLREEIMQFASAVRRIVALLLLAPALQANVDAMR